MITVILTPTAPYTPKALHLTDASAKVTLGRNHDDIVCTDENGFFPCELAQTLSRRHAELFVGDKAKVYIKDLGSSNGTFLNEVKVDSDAPVEVKSGDTLRLGIDLERVVTECKAVVVRASIAGSAVRLIPTANGPFPVKALDVSEAKVLGREHDGIGCTAENGIFSYQDACVLSREHAEIFLGDDGKVYLKDLESFNGTYINDVKVTGGAPVEVKDGDIVRLGVDVVGPPTVQGEYKAVVAKVEIV